MQGDISLHLLQLSDRLVATAQLVPPKPLLAAPLQSLMLEMAGSVVQMLTRLR